MNRNFIFTFLSLLLPLFISAQEVKKITIIGRVIDEENKPIEEAQISNFTALADYFTDFKGYFTASIQSGDTLVISSLGHKPFRLIIPKDFSQPRLEIEIQLTKAYILLDEVTTLAPEVKLDLSFHKVGMDRDEVSQYIIDNNAKKNSGQMETMKVDFISFIPWLIKKIKRN